MLLSLCCAAVVENVPVFRVGSIAAALYVAGHVVGRVVGGVGLLAGQMPGGYGILFFAVAEALTKLLAMENDVGESGIVAVSVVDNADFDHCVIVFAGNAEAGILPDSPFLIEGAEPVIGKGAVCLPYARRKPEALCVGIWIGNTLAYPQNCSGTQVGTRGAARKDHRASGVS